MSTNLPRLLVATGNQGKLREYRELLKGIPFELVSLQHVGIDQEVEETGLTFRENARIKAQSYASMSGLPTLADDSGLSVDALGGDPGVKSARYGGDACNSDPDRVQLLLSNLRDVPWARRTARFRCVICMSLPAADRAAGEQGRRLLYAEGAVAGMIQYEPEGEEGFGYDPVFFLPSYNRTVAQLSLEEKNRISHRGDAARRAFAVLSSLSY